MKPALIEQHTATDKRIEVVQIDVLTTRGMQLREGTDAAAVARYAEAYREGVALPPIVVFHDEQDNVDDDVYYLADGHHRVAAAKRAALDDLPAIIKKGNRRAALLYAATANGQHGVPLTNDDKRRIVATILADAEWRALTDRALADMLHVSPHLIAKGRAALPADQQSTVRKTADGRTMNTAGIGKRKAKASAPPAPPPILNQAQRTADVVSLSLILGLHPRLAQHSETALLVIAALLLNDVLDPVHRDNLMTDTGAAGVSVDLAIDALAADLLVLKVEGGADIDHRALATFATALAHWRKGKAATVAHIHAVQPRLPTAEPETLTAADVTDPEPPSTDQRLRAAFVERLTEGKFAYRASDQTLLALALITGVEGSDARYSTDLLTRSSTYFAEALAREIAHHLATRTPKVAQLPALPDLCTLFGISYSDLVATAGKAVKP